MIDAVLKSGMACEFEPEADVAEGRAEACKQLFADIEHLIDSEDKPATSDQKAIACKRALACVGCIIGLLALVRNIYFLDMLEPAGQADIREALIGRKAISGLTRTIRTLLDRHVPTESVDVSDQLPIAVDDVEKDIIDDMGLQCERLVMRA